MAQQGGATDDATDIPESPPSPDFPIASNATAKTPIMTDPLGYIAITLKEVERGFDELNQGLGYTAKYGGRRTVRERDEEFQLSLSKILIDQQLQIKKLAEQVTELSTTEAAKDEGEGEEEEEEEEELEDHPLLEPLGLIEAHLGELQETNADQALDIHRLADTFEKFGDLGNFVAWLGAWVRWVLAWTWDSGYAMILAFALAGFLVGVMHRKMLADAANAAMAAGAEAASRIELISESNVGVKGSVGGGGISAANSG